MMPRHNRTLFPMKKEPDKITIKEVSVPSFATQFGVPTINLVPPRDEMILILRIVERATELIARHPAHVIGYDPMNLAKDIANLHLNGYRLRLWQLLASDGGDFMREIVGISKYTDRIKGGLLVDLCNGWRPEFLETVN